MLKLYEYIKRFRQNDVSICFPKSITSFPNRFFGRTHNIYLLCWLTRYTHTQARVEFRCLAYGGRIVKYITRTRGVLVRLENPITITIKLHNIIPRYTVKSIIIFIPSVVDMILIFLWKRYDTRVLMNEYKYTIYARHTTIKQGRREWENKITRFPPQRSNSPRFDSFVDGVTSYVFTRVEIPKSQCVK